MFTIALKQIYSPYYSFYTDNYFYPKFRKYDKLNWFGFEYNMYNRYDNYWGYDGDEGNAESVNQNYKFAKKGALGGEKLREITTEDKEQDETKADELSKNESVAVSTPSVASHASIMDAPGKEAGISF